jgi:hypothetical protein
MDPTQVVIIAISIVLTSLFIALGVQVWFILKEFRISIQKVNKMLDDGGRVSGAVGDGFSNVSGLMTGIKTGLSLVTSMHKKGSNDE